MVYDGWFPTRVFWEKGIPRIEWEFLGEVLFTDPFVADTISRARSLTGSHMLSTGPKYLEYRAQEIDSLPLRGLIFHVSRCGSTVVSRALAQLKRALIISQPIALSDMLDGSLEFEESRRLSYVRSLVKVMGSRLEPAQQIYSIKLTSYLLLHLSFLKTAFPDVKRVFVFRDPIEVMVSVLDNPASFLKMKTEDPSRIAKLLAAPASELSVMSREEYTARMLGKFYDIISNDLVNSSEMAVGIDYRSLPESLFRVVLPHFGIDCSAEEEAVLRHWVRLDSKSAESERLFTVDSWRKQAEASANLRQLAAQWAEPQYVNLKKMSPYNRSTTY